MCIIYATMLNEDEVISDYAPKEIHVQYPAMDEIVILMGAKHNIMLNILATPGTGRGC